MPSRELIQPCQGLAPGRLCSLVVGLVIALGTATRTPADDCHGIPEGSSGYHTTSLPCDWENHKPNEFWYDYYFHNPGYRQDHYYHHPGTPACVYLTSTCGPGAATALLSAPVTVPLGLALGVNYPNPFNPATIIPFSVPVDAGEVELTVYNVSGQLVRHVWSGPLPAGEHRLAWDGRDALGRPAAAGVYLYQLQVGERRSGIRKMIKLQ